jgi:predicted type IV restriction endonuclease
VVKSRLKEQAINQVKNNIKKVEREADIIRSEAANAGKVLIVALRNTGSLLMISTTRKISGRPSFGRKR